jgi:uncharacterized membrane protein
MKGGAKFLGHSVHPILIVFPLGLLSAAVIMDMAFLLTDAPTVVAAAYWMIVSGLAGGVLAAFFGWIDWFAIPSGTRAKSVGLIHGVIMAAVLIIFAASLYFRHQEPTLYSPTGVFLGLIGAGLALIGGWFGGELVERLGIGVHPGANTNAPSSLTTEMPADDVSLSGIPRKAMH